MITIMVLGAGIYQVPLIRKAKDLGIKVVVVSPAGNYPGILLADYYVEIDTREKEAVLKAAKLYQINGILTTGTDVAVPTIGYVVDQLGLNGTGLLAANRSMNKVLMKYCFIDNGIKSANFRNVSSLEKLKMAAEEIGFPVMVKAVDSSGSRGIVKVDFDRDLEGAFEEAKSISVAPEVILEKYLEGYEIGAQAIIVGKRVVDVLLHADEVTPPPVSAPIGHSMPLNIPDELSERTKQLVVKAVEAIGLENTISNVDIMIVDNTPYILEIGARMGATCLPENISIFCGFDAYEFLINLALNNKPQLPRCYVEQANAAVLLCASKTGIVKNIYIPDKILENPALVNLSVDIQVGDRVKQFRVGPDRIGQVITIANSESEAVIIAHELACSIEIEIE